MIARRARVFYSGPRATLCDICEEENCGSICTLEAEADPQRASESKEKDGNDGGGAATLRFSINFLTILIFLRLIR